MKKSILSAILCTALVCTCFAGCRNAPQTDADNSSAGSAASDSEQESSEASGKKVTLSLLYWADETQTKLLQDACRSFEEENPDITVKEQALPADGTFDQYIQAAKEKNTLPNISYMGEGDIQKYYEMGILEDITDLVESGTIPQKLDAVTIKNKEGKVIGVGLSNQLNLLFYSKSKLKAAGVEAPPTDVSKAWDWDTFVKNCQKLTKDANGKTADQDGFDAGKIEDYGFGFNCLREFHLFWGMYANGGGVVSPDGKTFLMDQDKSAEAVQKFADLVNKYHVCSPATYSWTGGAGGVADGLAGGYAMMVNGSWDIANAEGDEDIGVGALPKMENAVTMNCGAPLVIYKTDDPDILAAAKKFYVYLVDPNKNLPLLNSGAWLPNEQAWYTDDSLLSKWGADYPEGAKDTILSYSNTPGSIAQWPAYYVPAYAKMNAVFEKYVDKILTGKDNAKPVFAECMPEIKKQFETGTVG